MVCLLIVVLTIVSVPVHAQSTVAMGDQVQLNSLEIGDQVSPVAAADENGNFVVVWESDTSPGSDDSGTSILARRFDADGSPLGTEFQVNTFIDGFQITPSIGMRPNGEFIVVWGSELSDGSDDFYSIQAQRHNADGTPAMGQFQVNSFIANIQESPSVAMAPDGSFFVTWQSLGSPGSDNQGRSIQGLLFDPDGTPHGSQFQINTYAPSDQADPFVAVGHAGNYVVTWFNVAGSAGSDDSGRSIQAQLIGGGGQHVGGEFQVNTYIPGNQYNPSVDVDGGGNFVVAWSSNGSPFGDSDYAILAQRYDAAATPVGGEFQVNSYIEYVQSMPSVAMDDEGDFFIAWRSGDYLGGGPDGDRWGISGQTFATDGSSVDDEFVVNNETADRQTSPFVVSSVGRRALAVWQSTGSLGGDADESIQGRRYLVNVVVFSDGFESGDSGAWSATVGG